MNISPPASTDRAALLQRVLDILMRPRDTWLQIDAEDGNPARIYLGYLVFLAAIPAVAGFIGEAGRENFTPRRAINPAVARYTG